METGRGCPRLRHCSFCSEGLAGSVEFRETEDIINEVDALINCGVKRFRIGRQADIIQYKSRMENFRGDFPEPNPAAVKELFNHLKVRRDTGLIEVLNIDNGNPGSIANWPDESALILSSIADAVTPGDTLPFGVESFDLSVIKQNNLKTTPEETVFAVKMINEICGHKIDGIPLLLPGINLIQGLRGETAETFKTNYRYLMEIAEKGLLVKRINIRKLLPYPGTGLYNEKPLANRGLLNRFEYFREKIRNDIDRFMLKKIYPTGTVIKNNLVLDRRDSYSFAKQIASYSITVKIPEELELKSFQDILVTGHRERSLSGIPLPFNINTANQKALESVPGINRDTASGIIIKRPFNNISEVSGYLNNVPESLKEKLIDQIKL
jgi:radical SAM superfamily enzyme with C-terminal helix-hairpin-helix motif